MREDTTTCGWWLVVLLVGCLVTGAARAQTSEPVRRLAQIERVGTVPSDPIRFDHLTIEDGLSQNAVSAITQDEQGFLWFGTSDGLNRYDGYTFTVFRHVPSDATSLSSSLITALYVDRGGIESDGQPPGVVEVRDGRDALQLARAVQPDVIISDLVMPGMDATALFHALKADSDLAAVPILFVSGEAQPPTGAVAFLAKPFNATQLRSAVGRLLDGSP